MQRLRYSRYLKTIIILLDLLIVSGVFFYFFIINYSVEEAKTHQNYLTAALLILFWVLLSGTTKLYTVPRNLTYTLYLEKLIIHIFLFLFGIVLLARVSNNDFIKNERFIIAFTLFFVLFFVKSLIFFALKYIRTLGKNFRNVMFLSDNSSTEIIKNIIEERKDYGFKIYNYPHTEIKIEELKDFWQREGIHTLFLPSENALDKNLENEIFKEAEMSKVRINLIPNIIQNEFFSYDLSYLETQPILTPIKFPLDNFMNFYLKRTFDIVFSIIVLLLIGVWLIPLVAILIKLDSKGGVFFLQERYGYHDEVFRCIKFRTMHENEHGNTKTTEENDARITKLGKFLRKSSIDEFPQFFNVLMGDMSVVGPRPHMILIDDFYKPKISRYSIRSMVKPGITGLAQANGLRGDHGDMNIEMKKRILADSFYVKNWSVTLDFVIILKTIFILFKGDKKAR